VADVHVDRVVLVEAHRGVIILPDELQRVAEVRNELDRLGEFGRIGTDAAHPEQRRLAEKHSRATRGA